jgi:hypothetical protein
VDAEDPLHAALLDELWPDVAGLAAESLEHYLTVAHEQCWEFLNRKADPEAIPARYVQAQIMQARAQRRTGLVGESDQIGPDGLTVTVYPMDRSIKALLRPRRGKPVVR